MRQNDIKIQLEQAVVNLLTSLYSVCIYTLVLPTIWDHENNQKLIYVYDRRLILSTVLPSRKLRVLLIFNIKKVTSKPHLLKKWVCWFKFNNIWYAFIFLRVGRAPLKLLSWNSELHTGSYQVFFFIIWLFIVSYTYMTKGNF